MPEDSGRPSCIDAAPLFCAGVTVYRALRHAKIQPGQRLAVFGVGGLGHLAVQSAGGWARSSWPLMSPKKNSRMHEAWAHPRR